MGEPTLLKAARFAADEIVLSIQEPSIIRDGNLELRLKHEFYYSETRIACREYSVMVEGEDAGTYYACLESDFEKLRDLGNVSIELDPNFYNQNLPYRATKALLPFFREREIDCVLITCDKDKRSVRSACEQLGAKYLDTIEAAQGKKKDRFVLEI